LFFQDFHLPKAQNALFTIVSYMPKIVLGAIQATQTHLRMNQFLLMEDTLGPRPGSDII
jgi:hypothetical protein